MSFWILLVFDIVNVLIDAPGFYFSLAGRLYEYRASIRIFTVFLPFSSLYNHIQPATGLGWSSDYYLFKEGIKPMWEDPNNINGGRWLVQVF